MRFTPKPPHITRRTALAGALAAGAWLAAPPPAKAAKRLTVVATTGMIADAARVIGGDSVEVRALMGPGVDPHSYRQTRSDVSALARADLVLWHGLYLEAQLEPLLQRLARRRTVVAVGEGVPKDRLLRHDAYEDQHDPHVWMDPNLWLFVVDAIRDALSAAAPSETAAFAARAAAYASQIEALNAAALQVLQTPPHESRILVTAHDAFRYFGAAYGYEVLGIQGISTQSEAGLTRMAELVDMLVARDIGAVFVESSVSNRSVRALIEGAAAQNHTVAIGGELFSDAMGPEGTYEGTYLGMIDHNVTTIARALGGDAPAGGLFDTLPIQDPDQ